MTSPSDIFLAPEARSEFESESGSEPGRRAGADLLRALFDQAGNALALLRGPQHVFELSNDAYRRMMGGRPLPGCSVAMAPPESPCQDLLDSLDAVYRSGRGHVGHRVDLACADADGITRKRQVDFSYQPIFDGAGRVVGILLEGVDAGARAASEEGLHLAQRAGGIGGFEWFPESGKMLVSPTFRHIWGLDGEREVSADYLLGLIDERDLGQTAPWRMAAAGAAPADGKAADKPPGGNPLSGNPLAYVEYRIRRPRDGQLRWIARQGEVVDGPAPGRCRYVGVSFDVTARKGVEQALHASEERLAALFGQASVGLSELGLDGRFQRVNGALCAMLGRTQEQLLALRVHDILHPDDAARNDALLRRLNETGASFTSEKRYLKPDGSEVWVSSCVSALVDERGRPQALISVKTDITERRRVEQALHDLNETLEQRVACEVAERAKAEDALRHAQKMEAVGQLTGGVAHDFNNVLQIISGNLQLLQGQACWDGVAAGRLETAIAAVERGATLSAQLLAFARRQPLRPVVADLGRLVRGMDALLRRALGEAIEVAIDVADGLWHTLVDRGQLENVILNLAINGRDAMAGAGKLGIALGNVEVASGPDSARAGLPAGQYVALVVSDTGRGMSGAVLERAFEPFFTTKPEGEGSGLGLAMAYGFVSQSQGHIRMASEPGRGTCVHIHLPRCRLAVAPEAAPADDAVVGGRETILVVEDDAGVRATVVDMLTGLGYAVRKADDGAAALALLGGGVAVDLLFTDVVMPGPVRGAELARQARQLLPGLAVLFTSGYPQGAVDACGRLAAGVELLSKPYRREELARKLRQVLAQRGPGADMPAPAMARMARELPLRPPAAATELAPPSTPDGAALNILVVEDNIDSQSMVCELVGMLGHRVRGVDDGEQARDAMRAEDFDVLFTDVSLPGMSGIALARLALRDKPHMRVIFSTGYGKEALERLGFPARILRKPYDLQELKAALDERA